MKTSNFMVGDYLMHNGFHYRVIQVDGIVRDGWMIENGEEDCGEPIPLTPEILVKNGFVLDDEWYIYTEQGVNIEVAFRDDNKFVYDLSILTGSGSMDIHAKYLHELQHAMRMFNINKTIEL